MNKPTVLHCINSLGTGGAEVLLKNTIPLLPEFNHVICYLNKPDDLLPELNSFPAHCLEHRGWGDSIRTITRMRDLINAYQVDLVHSHLLDATLLSRLACPARVRFAFTIHSPLSEDAFKVNKFSLWAEKLTYSRRQTVISVSGLVEKDYNNWIGIRGNNKVLYNYVGDRFFDVNHTSKEELKSQIKLVAVGNLSRAKNYTNLIEAFAQLDQEKYTLDIYGDGALRNELQARIDSLQVAVTLKGRVKDVSKVLPQYDAYIMPSIFEGFGIAPMEAMAVGLPVLLSDLDVFREVAGELPFYFNPEDPSAIAATIEKAFSNWNEMKARGEKGRSLVYSKASRHVYTRNLRSIYAELISVPTMLQPQVPAGIPARA